MKSFFPYSFHIYKYQINIKSLFDTFAWAHIYDRIGFKSKKADIYSINMNSVYCSSREKLVPRNRVSIEVLLCDSSHEQ